MAQKNVPPKLEVLRKLRKPVRNVNQEHKNSLGTLEKLAVWITDHVGTMGFFLIIFSWTAIWLSWNTVGPESGRFDPYPAFVLWLFISNVIQIFLLPLVMVGQNLQARHAEFRSESDFEVNTKAEREIETIIVHLENQNDLILEILRKMEERK